LGIRVGLLLFLSCSPLILPSENVNSIGGWGVRGVYALNVWFGNGRWLRGGIYFLGFHWREFGFFSKAWWPFSGKHYFFTRTNVRELNSFSSFFLFSSFFPYRLIHLQCFF
jgi:hypothetical protein